MYQPVLPIPRRVRGSARAAILAGILLAATQVIVAVTAWPSGATYGHGWQRDGNADLTASWDFAWPVLYPMMLVAYVAGSLWLWHVRSNVATLRPAARVGRSRGWAWGGWVTPVVFAWFPYQVVRDTARATVRERTPTLALPVWWALWLAWLLTEPWTSDVIFQLAPASTHLLGIAETLDAAVLLGALVLWIRTIREVTAVQETWLDDRDRELAASYPWAAHG